MEVSEAIRSRGGQRPRTDARAHTDTRRYTQTRTHTPAQRMYPFCATLSHACRHRHVDALVTQDIGESVFVTLPYPMQVALVSRRDGHGIG